MKFIHLADLHLGKRLLEQSLLEDQEYILDEILKVIDGEGPDAVLIAGDVYDKAVPSAEAMTLLNRFLTRLAHRELPVFLIAGNHDSAERVAFGAELLEKANVHIAPVYGGKPSCVTMMDSHGPVHVWMLPYLRPSAVRSAFPDDEVEGFEGAYETAVAHLAVEERERNVLLAHLFVTDAVRSESEEVSVGGADNVSAKVFDPFDYVALGHLHGPQWIGRETVRYAGSPLKYSFGERDQEKSVTVVEMGEKGDVNIREVPLTARLDMKQVEGMLDDILTMAPCEDYMHVVLQDPDEKPDAVGTLRKIFPNLLKVTPAGALKAVQARFDAAENVENVPPLELIRRFFAERNGFEMNDEQQAAIVALLEKMEENA